MALRAVLDVRERTYREIQQLRTIQIQGRYVVRDVFSEDLQDIATGINIFAWV